MESLENYEFTSLSSSAIDIRRAENYLGRLYVLPASSQLAAVGIAQQWFLTHAADFITSGYVEVSGNWSLSPYRSVEPTFEYFPPEEIFNKIFSPEYVLQVQALQQRQQQQPDELQQFDRGGAVLYKNDAASGGEEDNDSPPKSVPPWIWEADFPNLAVLQQLVLAELEKSEAEREDVSEPISPPEEERDEQREIIQEVEGVELERFKKILRALQPDTPSRQAPSEQKETGGKLDFEREC